MILFEYYIFFFKQKTAYEMRISDWSSDVCSSDLQRQQRDFIADGRNRQRREDQPPPALTKFDGYRSLCILHRVSCTGSNPIAYGPSISFDNEASYVVITCTGSAGLLTGGPPYSSSEEHTSELQSLMRTSSAGFCLQKKKKPTATSR